MITWLARFFDRDLSPNLIDSALLIGAFVWPGEAAETGLCVGQIPTQAFETMRAFLRFLCFSPF